MNRLRLLLSCLFLLWARGVVAAEEPLPGDRQPLLQLQTKEPTAPVTALAFAFVGEEDKRQLVLYAGGYDKVVRTWLRGAGDKFEPGKKTYRLPIGPGIYGTINSVAVSPDGRWLAAAGNSVIRDASGFFDVGIVEPRQGITDPMLKDEGTIYLFDTRGDKVRLLRGHRGGVLALAFAPPREGKPPLLISAAREESDNKHVCVLRLWDAEKAGDALASSPNLPDPGNGRPGLAIWHSGEAPRQLCAALACSEHPLHVWNAAGEQAVDTVGKALSVNEPAAFWPEGDNGEKGTLFTCGTTGTKEDFLTHLFAWEVSGAKKLQAEEVRTVRLPERSLSYSLALLPARLGGPLSRAAFIQCLRKDSDPNHHDYALLLRGIGANGALTKPEAYLRLWQGGERPALAVSPDGRQVAVAGGPANEVRIYTVEDLVREELKPSQTFRSPGINFQGVAFVHKGPKRGLLLKRDMANNPWPGGVIFDVGERLLTEKTDGWEKDLPDLRKGEWNLYEPDDAEQKSYAAVVGRAGKRVGVVVLRPDQPWTHQVLLPPGAHKVPLLAIAYFEKGLPYLGLWNALSGEQVRQFTGHLSPIRRLAFDAAGQRLVSVADDKTVCVWRVDDLEQTLGQRGMLRGLALKEDKGRLRIADLDHTLLNTHNRAALKEVQADDVVAGLVVDGKVQRFATPHAFYQAIWKLKPAAPWQTDPKARRGSRAVLRIAERGDISLEVDQGIDDRKPLFSLFVTRDRHWVGWSPEGPYDTSDPEFGKKHIGWHRNTGKADAPTSFDEVGRFHDQFYRARILHYLFQRGEVADALLEWKKEVQGSRPHTTLWIAGLDARGLVDPNRPAIAQHPALLLEAEVSGIHPARVEKVEWQVFRREEDGETPLGPPVLFDGVSGTLRVDLLKQKFAWRRGVYEVRASVTLGENPAQPLTESIWFRYLPRTPTIEFSKEWIKSAFGAEKVPERHDCSQKKFHIEGRIILDQAVPGAQVLIRHNGRVKWEGTGLDLKTDLELENGLNDVEIVAVNKGAGDGELGKSESRTERLLLFYAPKPLLPRIHVLAVTPGDVVPARPERRAWIVDSPRVRIRGEINPAKDLTEATYRQDKEETQTLKRFKEARGQTFRFDEEVILKKAGRVELVFRASTKTQKADPVTIFLDYQPRLPSFRLDSPRVVEANVQEKIDLLGHLNLPADPYPYEVTKVLLKGKPVDYKLDAKAGELKMRTALQPGHNLLEIYLSNGHRNSTERIDVYRKQPPILSFKRINNVNAKSASFEAVVVMASSLTLKTARFARTKVDDVRVSNDERNLRDDAWKSIVRNGIATRSLIIKDVPVREGVNTFQLYVANEDGSAALTLTAKGEGRLPSPPEIRFESLPPNRVFEPRCTLRLLVHSAVPLRRLTLLRNDQEIKHLGQLEPDPKEKPPVYRYTIAGLTLKPGMNVLAAEASNAGGVGNSVKTNVTYVEPAAIFRVEGYKLSEREKKLRGVDSVSPSSRIELYGSLRGEASLSLNEQTNVRVWVNDFEQHGELKVLKSEPGVWRFSVPLRLNREENRIKVRFPKEVILKQDDVAQCIVRCKEPEKRQRLHLLIVAPGRQDIEKLTAELLKTLGAKDIDGDRFRADAFSGGGRVHGPTRGDDKPEEIEGILRNLGRELLEESDKFNDVVIVYFRGEIRRIKDKRYLLTWSANEKTPLEKRSIDCDRIREVLGNVLGAKLLLLDVKGKPEAAGPLADASGLIGDFQYIWLGNDAKDPKRRYLLQDLNATLNNKRFLWGVVKRQLEKDPRANLRPAGANPEGYNDILLKSVED